MRRGSIVAMSRAFVKESDGADGEEPAELQVSPHRNLVTPDGLALIEAAVERLRAELSAARSCRRPFGHQAHPARPALLERAPAHGRTRQTGSGQCEGALRIARRPREAGWRHDRVPDRRRGRSGPGEREDFLRLADRETIDRRCRRRRNRVAGRRRGDHRDPLAPTRRARSPCRRRGPRWRARRMPGRTARPWSRGRAPRARPHRARKPKTS